MKSKIENAQKLWGEGIVHIGKVKVSSPNDVKEAANKMLDDLYDFRSDQPEILFKPTLASKHPFRINRAETLSYFIGGSVEEDKGFALKPWKKVEFDPFHFFHQGDHVFVMGRYVFIDYQNSQTPVDYTFVYRVDEETDSLKIILHHSSLPY